MVGSAGDAPLVSVIIATYNWSAALRLAITSVQRQTIADFEVLVVGDACTDDSQTVVEDFDDSRIRWSNLAVNCGCQQGPNNFGLATARGEWIAYLGHDDIWAPRHLETTVAAARAAKAEVAVGGMIMYGPPGSGATRTAGIFGSGRCADTDFVPPSAMLHSRALIDRIGLWAAPGELRMPIDCDFFQRARAVSEVAATGEVTVFKFNATSRRNAYQIKSTAEQQACLAGLEGGDRFIAGELTKVVASAVTGDWYPIQLHEAEPGVLYHLNRMNKGVEPRYPDDRLYSLTQAERFGLEHEEAGFEWHPMEHSDAFGAFRWTAGAERSTIELPVRIDQPIAVRLHLLAVAQESALKDLVLVAQGVPIETQLQRTSAGTWLVSGLIEPGRGAAPVPYVQVALSGITAVRPVDSGVHTDQRRLGAAVSWIEIAPAA
jgi:glycosyltransferase involved in cell wall biosynthesis